MARMSGVAAADEFSMLELLIGLPNIRVLRVEKHDGVLEIHLETAVPLAFCGSCGMAGVVKDRPKVRYADLPAFGQQAVLVWHKHRWKCPGENSTWTEERPDIAARSLSAMTHRAGIWATIQIGRYVRPVSQVAAEIGVSWNTVMAAVMFYGGPLVDDPARLKTVNHMGVDETVFQSAGIGRRRSFVTAVSDLEARKVLDVFEGRQRVDLAQWLAKQPVVWRDQIAVVVTDLHEPFRKAISEQLPGSTLVADPMHVVMSANRCPDKTRRRVQNEQLAHRGRAHEPLHGVRKLLMIAAEKLAPRLKCMKRGCSKNSSVTSTPSTGNPKKQRIGLTRSSLIAKHRPCPKSVDSEGFSNSGVNQFWPGTPPVHQTVQPKD
jgi:transposase